MADLEYAITIAGVVDDDANPDAEDEVMAAASDFVKELEGVSKATYHSMNFQDVDIKDDEEADDGAVDAPSEPAPPAEEPPAEGDGNGSNEEAPAEPQVPEGSGEE